jgi:uncharacterized protein
LDNFLANLPSDSIPSCLICLWRVPRSWCRVKPICLITGASDGFGLALARCFARHGYNLVLTARGEEKLQAAAAAIESAFPGVEIICVAGDMTDAPSVRRLAEAVCERFGRLDVLVNAVGLSDRGLAVDVTEESLLHLMRTNVLAAVHCTKQFLPLLQESQGKIVNVGSLAAKFGSRWMGGYALAKHALAGWTQQLRLEVAPLKVHVMLVSPGPIQRASDAPRYQVKSEGLPAAASRPAGGAKLKGLDPDRLAEQTYRALRKNKADLIAPRHVRCLVTLCTVWPALGEWVLVQMTGGTNSKPRT